MQQENNHTKSSFTGTSLYLFTAKFFPALAIFLSYILYSKNLSALNYGNYQAFWIQLTTLIAFATIGFPVLMLTYPAAKAIALLRQLTSRQLSVYGILLVVFAIIFAALQFRTNGLPPVLSILFFVSYTGIIITDALLIALRSFRVVISTNIIYALIFLSIHFFNLHQGYNLYALVLALLALISLRLGAGIVIIYNISKQYTAGHEEPLDWNRAKKLWLQLGVNDVIQVLFRWLDKFILSFILAKELLGIYVNATVEIAILPLIFSAVSSAAVQHWASQNHQSALQLSNQLSLLHYCSRILSSIVFPLFFFLLFFRIEFLTTVFSEANRSGVWIFVCAQLVLPVRAYPFTALLQSHHRGDLINKGSLIDFIIACILMYPLYLIFGLPGLALSFVISTYWQAGYYLVQSSLLLGIPVARLIPYHTLIRKFLLYGSLFGLAYFSFTSLLSGTGIIFWAGIIFMVLCGGISLLYEWNKNKQNNEYTSQ